jgi:hypothetical protein
VLKVSTKKKQAPLRLDLGGGSALLLRKADSFDQIAAETEAARIVVAIESSEEAISTYLLGDADIAADRDPDSLRSVVTEIEIAMRVVSSVENIELDDVPQTAPSRSLFAALFLEPWTLNAFRAKSRGDLHERTILGNGSEPSPNGAPAAESPIADPADGSEQLAPEDNEARAESAAPSASTEN